ncbi:MAG TPA: hypothetical protein ENK26_00755 [Gammaproteobacteria bacterium]|nr:hypothetical protein [Gammaproteobacteria bacterium]
MLTQALPLLLEKLPTPAIVNAPIWLDLTSSTGQDKEWEEARRRFYQRLNENREVLRTRLRPVVIILPAKERFVFRELAPDLWAIRDITLATSAWIPRDDSPVVEKQAPSTDSPKPFSFRQQKAIDEWERVRQRQRGRDVLIVGDRAFKAAYKARQLEVARKISGEMEALARKLVEQVGETPESLRDLSISLNNTASIAKAQGDLEAATRQYGEAVGIYRSLLERFPAMSGLRAELDNVESQYRSVAPR